MADSPGERVVLVVEDEPNIAILVGETLRRHGIRVRTATDVIHALETFEELGDRLALVITDVIMPGLVGTELIRHMLSRNPRLKVLFITGYVEQAEALSNAEGFRFPVIQKPFSVEKLAATVTAMIETQPRA